MCLSRFAKQSIRIRDRVTGEIISLKVIELGYQNNKPKVRLGIQAAQRYEILRGELIPDDSESGQPESPQPLIKST